MAKTVTPRDTMPLEAVTREWFEKHVSTLAPSYGKKVRSLFERQVFPAFGGKSIADVEPSDILKAARHVEENGAVETAHRMVQLCGQLLRYGIATGRVKYDITQGLHGALTRPKSDGHAGLHMPCFGL